MKLRWDPFQIFRSSKTPAGLYARKKWLHEQDHSNYKHDFEETLRFLLSGQSFDGSWEHSFIITIQRLFGLHLTIRDEIEPVRKGLDWLAEQISTSYKRKKIRPAEKIHDHELTGLPFTQGAFFLLITSATLFLSSVFGRHNDPGILKIYNWLQVEGSKGSGRWCGWSSYSNILRAFVVHPHYAMSKAVSLAVKNLEHVQNHSGKWVGDIPFFQTANALAHLDATEVGTQLALVFNQLHKSQRHDGTWSRSQPEWNNFLIIHALKNKGELS